MTLSVLYWVLMLLWLLFSLWSDYTPNQPYPFRRGAWSFMTFILLLILGWRVFGSPVK
jgi:hypothetical protein